MSLSRFKGCLIGAAIADCVGALFEGMPVVKQSQVLEAVQKKLEEGNKPHSYL